MNKLLKFGLFVSCFIFAFGCSPLANGGKSLYTTFFAEQGILYFIKPVDFQSDSKRKAFADFTFKSKEKLEGTTTINISFHTEKPIHKLKEIKIVNENTTITLERISFMFIEKRKSLFESRFTTSAQTPDLKKLFADNHWVLKAIDENGQTYEFQPTSMTKKKIKTLNENVFVIFQ